MALQYTSDKSSAAQAAKTSLVLGNKGGGQGKANSDTSDDELTDASAPPKTSDPLDWFLYLEDNDLNFSEELKASAWTKVKEIINPKEKTIGQILKERIPTLWPPEITGRSNPRTHGVKLQTWNQTVNR
jgi:hypothetical protein